jgi:CHRD domain-containing protein/PEP-CTERM motif-containing protein
MKNSFAASRLVACAAVLATLGLAPAAQAALVTFSAPHLTGAQETPPNPSNATGSALVTFDTTNNTVSYDVPFANLSTPINDAHIHWGPPGVAGPVLLPLALPPSPSNSGTLIGTLTSSDLHPDPVHGIASLQDVVNAGLGGNLYVNVHSVDLPNGEIRGQLAPVPEPSTYALLLLGLVGTAAVRIRGGQKT